MKFRTANKLMFGNTNPMEEGKGLRGQFMKNIHDGNSMECPQLHKTHVFYSSTGDFGPILLKYFAGNCMKCLNLEKFNVGHLNPKGVIITKNYFFMECMKCTELHETHVS